MHMVLCLVFSFAAEMERIQIVSCMLNHVLRNVSVIVGNGETVINSFPRWLLFSSGLLNDSFEPKEGEHCPYESATHCHSLEGKAAGQTRAQITSKAV